MTVRFLKMKTLTISLACIGILGLTGCNDDNDKKVIQVPEPIEKGAWSTGDLHVHTIQSDDAQVKLADVLDLALNKYSLDWMLLSNHLRLEKRDHEGNDLINGSIAFSQGMKEFEVPYIDSLIKNGKYPNKTVYSAFEWDMPTHDHVNIGIGIENQNNSKNLKAVEEFEYLFTNKDKKYFSNDILSKYSEGDRAFSSHADSVKALKWIKTNYPNSYMILNHPSRGVGKYSPAQIRELHDTAPDIFYMIEGMIGNQMEPNRGGYETAYIDDNLVNRSYGGVDYYVAKVGGLWDSLLGEGRHIWNIANSDYHFTVGSGKYTSGYAPGEYSKTYLWKNGNSLADVVKGLKDGRSFGVYGDLINALDFNVNVNNKTYSMGQTLTTTKGDNVTVTIKFKSPEYNNEQFPFNSGNSANSKPKVDHVDLIVGDVVPKYEANSSNYNNAKNPTTKVLARFTSKDWKTDANGFNVITYKMKLDKNQYLRLRGTNLGVDVEGETKNGEPLIDLKNETADHQQRFNEINKRNYADLWFYSNPIFLNVK